jgi:hypothetical protein
MTTRLLLFQKDRPKIRGDHGRLRCTILAGNLQRSIAMMLRCHNEDFAAKASSNSKEHPANSGSPGKVDDLPSTS